LNDGPLAWEPSSTGRKQFFEYQSSGTKPTSPDPYFWVLIYGKQSFDFLCSEYQQLYRSKEWWGLYSLWLDWKGKRWVLPYLLKWWKKETRTDLPDWIDKEYYKN